MLFLAIVIYMYTNCTTKPSTAIIYSTYCSTCLNKQYLVYDIYLLNRLNQMNPTEKNPQICQLALPRNERKNY